MKYQKIGANVWTTVKPKEQINQRKPHPSANVIDNRRKTKGNLALNCLGYNVTRIRRTQKGELLLEDAEQKNAQLPRSLGEKTTNYDKGGRMELSCADVTLSRGNCRGNRELAESIRWQANRNYQSGNYLGKHVSGSCQVKIELVVFRIQEKISPAMWT